ncbi:MAG: NAD(P)H-dependent oxidoreductase subunit E, partial [Anaerolineaceae bacterium]|nr:NAD(P)H-dependent oxidoreductase subunit E [Anaerolineaceae bacterium]
ACDQQKPAIDLQDRRWKLVNLTMKKHNYSPKALIETLHVIQDSFGYIDMDAMRYVAQQLRVPVSKVFGVVTFYHGFTCKPTGEHTLILCTGTACYVKGNDKMVEYMKQKHNLDPNQTTSDNKLSFMTARCVGACGLAPVMILDGQIVGKLGVEDMQAKIEEWLNHANQ